jgi:hypothetical protein
MELLLLDDSALAHIFLYVHIQEVLLCRRVCQRMLSVLNRHPWLVFPLLQQPLPQSSVIVAPEGFVPSLASAIAASNSFAHLVARNAAMQAEKALSYMAMQTGLMFPGVQMVEPVLVQGT